MNGSTLRAWLVVVVLGIMGSARTAMSQDCIPDLVELNLRMDAEWVDVLLNGNATREAPYRYVLCPNTVYYVDGLESQIVPILDSTYVNCGDEGLLENNCTIEERVLNDTVIMPEIMLLRAFSNYNRFLTVFSGFKFDTSYGASAFARDTHPMRVVFRDCYWTGSRGYRIIDNQVPIPQYPIVGEEAMIVQVEDSIIEDEESLLDDGSNFESGGTPLNIAVFSRGGQLQFENVTFRNNHLNYFIFASIARVNIRDSLFVNNQVEEGLFASASYLTVTTTRFENNEYIVGSLSGADASLTSRFNEFHGNSGLADVVFLSVSRGTLTMRGEVTSSCFVDGVYLAGPVLTAGVGRYIYEDVFVAGVAGDCPNQPFLEDQDQLCFNSEGFYILTQPCLGRCDEETAFSSEICALDPKPSVAPTGSPKPTISSEPSARPTTPLPTEKPSNEPTYLSMLYGGTSLPTEIPTDPPSSIPVGSQPADTPPPSPLANVGGGTLSGIETRSTGTGSSSSSDEGFCESGAGPFVCIGLPVLVAAVVIAVAVVVALGGSGGGGKDALELEIPPRKYHGAMEDVPVGLGSVRSELS